MFLAFILFGHCAKAMIDVINAIVFLLIFSYFTSLFYNHFV